MRRSIPVIHAGFCRSSRALSRRPARSRRAVGDRRNVMAPKRIGEERPGQQLVNALGGFSSQCAEQRRTSPRRLAPSARPSIRRRPNRSGPAVPPSTLRPATAARRCRDRSAAPAPAAGCGRGLAEAVDQRGVDLAGEQLDVGLVGAHAASISTCDSLIGGTAPIESIADNEEADRQGNPMIRRAPDRCWSARARVRHRGRENTASAFQHRWSCRRCGAHAAHGRIRRRLHRDGHVVSLYRWCL